MYCSTSQLWAVWARDSHKHGAPKLEDASLPNRGGRPTEINQRFSDIVPVSDPAQPGCDVRLLQPTSAEKVRDMCKSLLASQFHWQVTGRIRED